MEKKARPDILTGPTYKIRVINSEKKEVPLYLTVNSDHGKPCEIFIRCDDELLFEHMNALSILVSGLLQLGVSLEDIAKQLSTIPSPNTAHFVPGTLVSVPSIYARIAYEFNRHIEEMRTCDPQETIIHFME